jgi:hypothetical protein
MNILRLVTQGLNPIFPHIGSWSQPPKTSLQARKPLKPLKLLSLITWFLFWITFLSIDSEPLNEERLLGDSLMNNHNIMGTDKTIKFDSAQSVLKVKVGDEIKLTEADFLLLCKAFFAEIESKFL